MTEYWLAGHYLNDTVVPSLRYLQSNCTAFELLYFNTSDGVVIFNPSNLKDEQWASWCVPANQPTNPPHTTTTNHQY